MRLDDMETGVGQLIRQRRPEGRFVLDEQEMRFVLSHLARATRF
jgi:hypothetical protein